MVAVACCRELAASVSGVGAKDLSDCGISRFSVAAPAAGPTSLIMETTIQQDPLVLAISTRAAAPSLLESTKYLLLANESDGLISYILFLFQLNLKLKKFVRYNVHTIPNLLDDCLH